MSAPPRPKRPPHEWQRLFPGEHMVGRWGHLEATGPREHTHVDRGWASGAGYECARCGVVRLFAEFLYVDAEGERRWRQVQLVGFDWDSLTPMHAAPPCEVLLRPGSTAEDLVGLVDVRQLALDLRQGAAA